MTDLGCHHLFSAGVHRNALAKPKARTIIPSSPSNHHGILVGCPFSLAQRASRRRRLRLAGRLRLVEHQTHPKIYGYRLLHLEALAGQAPHLLKWYPQFAPQLRL
ncbi:MAG: hypothetical protein QGH66_05315 [Dehalococcoidia bacterium]|nr:hypothetical protein [Dehalococcoidia bacterium]MDP7240030.1 hypothetical protein [Dehalococcoidia bacterium]